MHQTHTENFLITACELCEYIPFITFKIHEDVAILMKALIACLLQMYYINLATYATQPCHQRHHFFLCQTNVSCVLITSAFAWYPVNAGNFEPSVSFSSALECSMRHTVKGSADFSPRVSQERSPLITLTSSQLINY